MSTTEALAMLQNMDELMPHEFSLLARMISESRYDGNLLLMSQGGFNEACRVCGVTPFQALRVLFGLRNDGLVYEWFDLFFAANQPAPWALLGMKPNMQDYQPAPIQDKVKEPGYVYLIRAEGTQRYKIGVTQDIDKRGSALQKQSPFPLIVVHSIEATDPASVEKALHLRFNENNVNGEWFEFTEVGDIDTVIELMNYWRDR